MSVTETEQAIKVGDLMYSSWGYDQTNVDFYKVVRITAKSAWIVRIGATSVEGSDGFMSCRVVPDPDVELCDRCNAGPDSWLHQADHERHHPYTVTPTMHRIRISEWDHQPRLTLTSYSSASLWTKDERGTYCSWYA